jgi:ketosteroid isomerase-like protein
MSAKDEVRKASEEFYAALNKMANGDAASMADIWSHSATVATMHPIGGRQIGYDAVAPVWEQVAHVASEGRVELRDQFIEAGGDMAYELGTERGQIKIAGEKVDFDHRVTNIYRREAGGWKIVLHHSDLSPAMMAVLGRLQSKEKPRA